MKIKRYFFNLAERIGDIEKSTIFVESVCDYIFL